MGKVESFRGKDKLVKKINKKMKKEEVNIVFLNDKEVIEKIEKENSVMFFKEIKMNLLKRSDIEAVNLNREENIEYLISKNKIVLEEEKEPTNIVVEKKRKINEELRNYLNVEAKYIKKYATLEYIAENNITLVTDEKQINDKIVIDEIKTLALENLNKKINIFLKEKNMERDCLEELYNFVLQEKIKIKVYILK